MAIYRLHDSDPVNEPVLVLALSGWVDAASVGTGAAAYLSTDGPIVATFDRDSLYDYRSNRPVLRFEDGHLEEVTWPTLDVRHAAVGEAHLMVMSGSEPDFRWEELSRATVDLATRWGVTKLITLGGVPAAVPHTLPPPILMTTSDPSLVGDDDQVIGGTLVVPGAAVSILTDALTDSGIPSIGYWAQVPHYLRDRYVPGVVALLDKVAAHLGIVIPMADLQEEAAAQRAQLDDMVEGRPDAEAYVQRLESIAGEEVPSADEIGAEVERFLREETGDDPFRSGPDA